MRILLLSQFFAPEPGVKGLPFARELARRGHVVEVLTGFPNYPGGKVYPGYRIRPWQREIIDGIVVNRVPLYPSHDKSALRRIANYAGFALSAAALGPFMVKRPDVIYAYHPPGTIGLPAIVLRALRGCPVVYDVQDLWPDTVSASGMMRGGRLFSLLARWCRLVYSRMDRVVVLSPGFRRTLIERGVPAEKIEVIYNWADETTLRRAADCARLGTFGPEKRFNVVFAGTMGLAQSLDPVLEAARICAETVPDARFVFVGGGVDKARLERRATEMRLCNAIFLPRQPREAVGAILAAADVLLVHLKDDPLFRITIPSKTQAYMSMGRPILMAVPGDAAELVAESQAGLVCPPENPAALAAAVRQFRTMAPETRELMGKRGRDYYDRHLSLRAGVDRFEKVFRDVCGRAASTIAVPLEQRRAA